MKSRLFHFIIGHKILILALMLAVTLFFGWFAARVEFNNTIETYFLEEDLRDYNRFLDQFGTDEIIVVAIEGEDAFTIENLRLVDAISQKLESLPHVRRVLSLTTAKIVYGEADTVHFDPRMEEIPSDPTRLRAHSLQNPIL